MATGNSINSQINTQKKGVLFLPGCFLLLPTFPKNPSSPSMTSHLLFILGENAPRLASYSLLSNSIPYIHFICEVDCRKEITQSSRSEMVGGCFFSSISKTISSQKRTILRGHLTLVLGLSQILSISFYKNYIVQLPLSCDLMGEALHRLNH